ncbi:hypothetical protein V2G26_019643 [Clonostachys chloroleuca]
MEAAGLFLSLTLMDGIASSVSWYLLQPDVWLGVLPVLVRVVRPTNEILHNEPHQVTTQATERQMPPSTNNGTKTDRRLRTQYS